MNDRYKRNKTECEKLEINREGKMTMNEANKNNWPTFTMTI